MSFGISARSASQKRRDDLLILDEIYAIMKQVISSSVAGNCSLTVTDSTMTQSTADVSVTGTVSNPTITIGATIINDAIVTASVSSPTVVYGDTVTINGTGVTLTSGTGIDNVIQDINYAGITGIVASKNGASQLVITYTPPNISSLDLVIGSGTANTALGLTPGTTTATYVTTANPTVIINGTTVTLGTTGTNLNSVIADINDANVSGVVASKNESNQLVLTYTAPAATTWALTIGAGTSNTDLGLSAATTTATNPISVDYYNVFTGATTDACATEEINAVIEHFETLGYRIIQQTNTTTGKTFQWVINY